MNIWRMMCPAATITITIIDTILLLVNDDRTENRMNIVLVPKNIFRIRIIHGNGMNPNEPTDDRPTMILLQRVCPSNIRFILQH